MLHACWKMGQFLLVSWAILIVLGLLGQVSHVGEKYAIVAVVLAFTAAGLLLFLHHGSG